MKKINEHNRNVKKQRIREKEKLKNQQKRDEITVN